MDIFDADFVFNVLIDNERVVLRDKKTSAEFIGGVYRFYDLKSGKIILETSNIKLAYRTLENAWNFKYE